MSSDETSGRSVVIKNDRRATGTLAVEPRTGGGR